MAVPRKILIVVPPLVHVEEGAADAAGRPDFELHRLVSPVEPLSAAADLKARGHEVRVLDMGLHARGRLARVERAVLDFRPDVVALVQSVLTFATAQDWDGAEVFALARRHVPDVVRILSGGAATNAPGAAVAAGVCDYSLKGEVDVVLGRLVDALDDGNGLQAVPGLSRRDRDGTVVTEQSYPRVDVARLPLPAYDLLDEEHHRRYAEVAELGKIRYPEYSRRYRDLMLSRGCVLRCSFCCVAHMRGPKQKRRRKTLAQVDAEIRQALDQGIEEIHIFDDLFAQDEGEILDFCGMLARSGLKFPWFVAQGMPLWPLTRDALVALAETGYYRLIAPFESGSDRVLRKVAGKVHSTTAHHHDVVGWASALGIEIIGMFVVGMPDETRDDLLATLRFAEDHPAIDYSVFSIATPMVGTQLMRRVSASGRLRDAGAVNRIIKRTVALYHSDQFSESELGVIRSYDWDRINFTTPERRAKYARMVGITLEQLDRMRQHSKDTFHRFFPRYDGPLSFNDLYGRPGLFVEGPAIPRMPY